MRLPKLKSGDAIEVIWIDTQTPKVSGWMTIDEYMAFRSMPMTMKSVGIFVENDNDYIGLCGCMDVDGDESTLIMAIPIGCIKSIRRLK
jgi:hypothetical protein